MFASQVKARRGEVALRHQLGGTWRAITWGAWEQRAREIAAAPQRCMRSDRLSSYRQWELSLDDALAAELGHGLDVLSSPEFLTGVERFVRRPR